MASGSPLQPPGQSRLSSKHWLWQLFIDSRQMLSTVGEAAGTAGFRDEVQEQDIKRPPFQRFTLSYAEAPHSVLDRNSAAAALY